MFSIESRLNEGDRAASERAVTLTDSQIRSVLVRAINMAKGRRPAPLPPSAGEKDRLLAMLVDAVAAVREDMRVQEARPDGSTREATIGAAEWIKALKAVRESCELRGDGRPGSRAYLDFLGDFIPRAGKAP